MSALSVIIKGTLIIYLIIISGIVNCSFWAITNQAKLEKRPYTQTAMDPSTSGPTYISGFDNLLHPKFREMHRYCDGQCFYAPDTCAATNEFKDCKVAASVAMHNIDELGDLYCDFFGPDNLRLSLCSTGEAQMDYRNRSNGIFDRFYTITLHRVLPGGSPPVTCSFEGKWNPRTGRRCRRSEFVGISFQNHLAPNLNDLEEEDLWYICTVDESHITRVSMWTKVDGGNGSAQRIMGTKPHLESGAGVVFSKIHFDEDTLSMGCQFVIQESNMTLMNPPINAAFFSNNMTNPVKVKLATGIVERDHFDDSVLQPFYNLGGIYPYDVYRGSQVKPTDEIFFDSLQVNISDALADPVGELNIESDHSMKMKELISKCDKPSDYPDIYIACYPPNEQKNCKHTGRCTVMFVVEIPRSDTSFKTITAYLYSLIPEYKSLRKVSRPSGYASIGFSFDDQMGRDVVISCHADGRSNISVYVSINFEKTNVYPGKVNYSHLITNTKAYGTVNRTRILCSWEMKTKFFVNMFDYEPDYRQIIPPGLSEKLEYDFIKKSVYLLIAAGNRNYPDGKIVHHDFSQVLQDKFNKTAFFYLAKSSTQLPNLAMSILTGILIVMYNIF